MKWISVKERLPSPKWQVLCLTEGGRISIGVFESSGVIDTWALIECNTCEDRSWVDKWHIAYWMPLPEKPDETKQTP